MERDLLKRISADPAVCFGKPCIRGTRIWVSLLLDLMAGGMTEAEILEEYPGLTKDDLRAALLMAPRRPTSGSSPLQSSGGGERQARARPRRTCPPGRGEPRRSGAPGGPARC